MAANLEAQKQLSEEITKYNAFQKEYQKVVTLRQTLDAQLNENLIVKEELDSLEEGAAVFKLIGPALMKQNLKESKENVSNRIKYIEEEVKRHDDSLKGLEKKQETQREVINRLQQQLQQSQVKAGVKA